MECHPNHILSQRTRLMALKNGYASVLFLAVFAAVALAIFSLYDTGIVASERIRMQNTADNVAYSTATMVTRDMNIIAITNRAMVANQVAIGQMVALASWANMVQEFAGNLETLGDFAQVIPYVGKLIEQITEIVYKATTQLKNIIQNFGNKFIFAEDKLIGLLYSMQAANHEMTLLSGKIIYDDIIAKNDSDVSANALSTVYNIQSFIKAYKGHTQYNKRDNIKNKKLTAQRFAEMANTVNDSRDKMMANRAYNVIPKITVVPWPVRLKYWGPKYGGTDYVMSKKNNKYVWSWTSLDTFSLWWSYRYPKKLFGWKTHTSELLPLGWGAAHALNKKLNTTQYNYDSRKKVLESKFEQNNWNEINYNSGSKISAWGASYKNKNAADLVKYPTLLQGEKKGDIYNNIKNVDGIKQFIDLKSNDRTTDGPMFSVLLSKGEDKLRTQKTIDSTNASYNRTNQFSIEENGGIPGDKVYALASAQSYFSRPDESLSGNSNKEWMITWGRKDGLKEYGNLYNPFWQTRLQKNNDNIIQLLLTLGKL